MLLPDTVRVMPQVRRASLEMISDLSVTVFYQVDVEAGRNVISVTVRILR